MTNLSDNRVAVGYIVAPQWRVGIGPNSEHFRRTVWITIRRVLSVDTGHIKHYTGAGRSRKTSTHFQEARSRLVYGMTSGPARSEWSWFRFLVSHVDFFPNCETTCSTFFF